MPVLDETSGQNLEYHQLCKHPKFAHIWNTSYTNEFDRLYQGVGIVLKGPKNQLVEGTNTFRIIRFEDIPSDRRKEIFHSMVVCEVRPQKEDPNRTRITVTGGHICYPGDIGTSTGSIDLVNIMLNSVLYRPNTRFVCFDAKHFYLQTPMDLPKYVCIKLLDITQEFIEEYNLTQLVHNENFYFEVLCGCYVLPQSVKIPNNLLRTRLEKAGYYESDTTPGLWRHKWCPIQFSLIVDDLGIEYVGKQHALHRLKILEQHYRITADWEGKKFAEIDLEWNYTDQKFKRTCRISMNGYIDKLLIKYGHPRPCKPQLSPQKHREVAYGAKE